MTEGTTGYIEVCFDVLSSKGFWFEKSVKNVGVMDIYWVRFNVLGAACF